MKAMMKRVLWVNPQKYKCYLTKLSENIFLIISWEVHETLNEDDRNTKQRFETISSLISLKIP